MKSLATIRNIFIRRSPLRGKIILLLVVLATTPVLLLGGVTLFLLDLSHREDVSRLELQLVGQRTKDVEKFFSDTLDVIRIVVGSEDRSAFLPLNASWQTIVANGILDENSAFEDVSIVNTDGRELVRKSRFEREEDVPLPLRDVSQMPWFEAAARGEEYIGDVYYTLSGPKVTIAAPVLVGADVIRVVSAEVNLAPVVRTIEHTILGTEGYAVLVDKNGTIIAHGAPGANAPPGTDFSYLERVQAVLGGATLDGLAKDDRYHSTLRDTPVVGAGASVPRSGWALLVEWPLADADDVINVVRMQIIQFTIVSIIAVFLLAPLLANRITRPIEALEAGAKEIEKGNFDKRVSVETGDELQDLAERFNKMAKGLKRLQELKDEFVFIAAHELKAPVTVIKGYMSMIVEKRDAVGADISNYLGQIDKANQNLVKLVQDLLQVARSEAGRIEIDVQPTAIAGVAQSVVDGFAVVAREQGITLAYRSDNAAEVLADPDKLKEVMNNLVSNAVKYTVGAGEVAVSHEVKDGMLVTHVKDTGVGISKDAQKKLFEKFYRVKAKGTEDVSGTGLGLWIIKQLIEKMGGTIWVRSEEGKGSTFSFSLPLAANSPRA